jgi:proteasome lid subunit RPN8/RPN11
MSCSTYETLRSKYDEELEHVGFVLTDGSIVECENISTTPAEAFDVSAEDLDRYCDEAVATWHTHPGAGSNLSVGDLETFLLWNTMLHYIVGKDDITCYRASGRSVIKHETQGILPRAVQISPRRPR